MQSSLTRVYTPDKDRRANVNSISIRNNSPFAVTVSFWSNVDGFRVPLIRENFSLAAYYSAELIDNPPLGLEYGDYLECRAGDSGSIVFNINGEEGVL